MGSNLGDSLQTLREAAGRLASLGTVAGASQVYESEPVGYRDQPAFTNAVVALDTTLEPLVLLDALLAIEGEFKRERVIRWGPRTLDLDLIQYGDPVFDTDVRMASPNLTLPHPRAHQRAFVLIPWLKAEPEAALRVDGQVRRVADLVAGLDTSGVRPGPDVDLLEGPW
jgi:dihydroneopterin aldolase/2-amino-4-hydroxy-6-hydroxymethyldihydropteridine diphosphokinase